MPRANENLLRGFARFMTSFGIRTPSSTELQACNLAADGVSCHEGFMRPLFCNEVRFSYRLI